MSVGQFCARVLIGCMLVWTVPVALHLAQRVALLAGNKRVANLCARYENSTSETALTFNLGGVVAVLIALAVMQ